MSVEGHYDIWRIRASPTWIHNFCNWCHPPPFALRDWCKQPRRQVWSGPARSEVFSWEPPSLDGEIVLPFVESATEQRLDLNFEEAVLRPTASLAEE